MTKIEWTNKTWQPVHGCTKISEACHHCYAEVMARRLQGNRIKSYEHGFQPTLNPDVLDAPYRWKKPCMVFVCSMGDLFHEDVPFEYIDRVMAVITDNPRHTFQILTKRAERMAAYFSVRAVPCNAWLGVTCESSKYFPRIDYLRSINGATVRFLSCEPLLGNMPEINLDGIDWVIAGGESGASARPTDPQWFCSLRDAVLGTRRVKFFFKQWGTWSEDGVKRSKYANGSVLDGRQWKEMPSVSINNLKQEVL